MFYYVKLEEADMRTATYRQLLKRRLTPEAVSTKRQAEGKRLCSDIACGLHASFYIPGLLCFVLLFV